MWRERKSTGRERDEMKSADFLIQRTHHFNGREDAAGEHWWRTFATCRVRGFHAVVDVGGTTASGAAGYTVYTVGATIGTASLGQLTLSTNAADYIVSATVTTTLAAGEGLRFLKGADATLQAGIMIEYEILESAVMS